MLREAVDENMTVGSVMQINLYKIWNGAEKEDITAVSEKIQFIIDIAKNLQKENRVFTLLLAHTNSAGDSQVIRCKDKDEDDATFTGETNCFCDALLVYSDGEVAEQTDSNILWIIVIICALAVLVFGFYGYQRKKDGFRKRR